PLPSRTVATTARRSSSSSTTRTLRRPSCTRAVLLHEAVTVETCRVVRGRLARRRRDSQRQGDREPPSLAVAVARGGARAAVQPDQVARDGEAETEPALLAVRDGFCLPEALEDVRNERRADALARVLDDELRARACLPEPDGHRTVRRRELHGVAQE